MSALPRSQARPAASRATVGGNRNGWQRVAWSALGFAVVYLVCVRTQLGQLVDEEAMLRLSTAANSFSLQLHSY